MKNIFSKSISQGVVILLFALVLTNLLSCKKSQKVENSASPTFLRTYPEIRDQRLLYSHRSVDGGYLLIASNGTKNGGIWEKFTIYKTDETGAVVTKTEVEDTIRSPKITPMEDGSVIVNSSEGFGFLLKISNTGKIAFKTLYFQGGGFYISNALRSELGGYGLGLTNGGYTGGIGTQVIETFDESGNELAYHLASDLDFGHKITLFNVYRQLSSDQFLVFGELLTSPWKWTDNAKFFVARVKLNGAGDFAPEELHMIDSSNLLFRNNFSNQNIYCVPGKDGSLAFCTFQRGCDDVDVGFIAKVNPDLTEAWRFRFEIGTDGTMPFSLKNCSDGNYLITGSCKVIGRSFDQPFACKISSNGKLLWKKIYDMPMTSYLSFGTEVSGGGYLFSGNTSSFGNGLNLNDMFLIKTDRDGNFH